MFGRRSPSVKQVRVTTGRLCQAHLRGARLRRARLPKARPPTTPAPSREAKALSRASPCRCPRSGSREGVTADARRLYQPPPLAFDPADESPSEGKKRPPQIGRASCRERV